MTRDSKLERMNYSFSKHQKHIWCYFGIIFLLRPNQIEIALSFTKGVEIINPRSLHSLDLYIAVFIGITREAIDVISSVIDIPIVSRSFLEKAPNKIDSFLPVLGTYLQIKRIFLQNLHLLLHAN